VTRRWTLGLFGFGIACAIAAVGFGLWSAAIDAQAGAYQQSLLSEDGFVNFTDEQYAFVNGLWTLSGSVLSLVSPAVICALAAAFAALGLLSWRATPAATDQTEAPAAS
jgi:hypothetical protein